MMSWIGLLIKPLFFAFSILPRRVHFWAGSLVGIIWFDVLRIRRAIIIDNIQNAYPDWPKDKVIKTGRQSMRSVGQNIVEIMLLPFVSAKWVEKNVIVEGIENYREAATKGTGVMILSLHMGSYDLGIATFLFLGIPVQVVTKEIKTKWLNNLWFSLRKKRGIKLIMDRKSSFEILRALKRKDGVIFVLDQFMGPPLGVKTKFFNRETGTAMGLALLVDRAESPVIPVYTYYRKDRKMVLVFQKEIPIERKNTREETVEHMTQLYTNKIEELVRLHPEQWMWVHRRWKKFKV